MTRFPTDDEYKRLLNAAADEAKREVKDMVDAEHSWRRFPPYPTDILSRADALLASKYGTDEPIDPRFVEVACEAMMAEQERCAKIAGKTKPFNYFDRETDHNDIYTGNVTLVSATRPVYRDGPEISKAIRGTE